MAGLGLGKDSTQVPQDKDGHLPTPLRRRGRAASPGIVASSAVRCEGLRVESGSDSTGSAPTSTAPARTADANATSVSCKRRFRHNRFIISVGVLLLCLWVWTNPDPDEIAPAATANTTKEAKRGPTLLDRVATALSCPARRADIIDILGGAPYEFLRRDLVNDGSHNSQEIQAKFARLPNLVANVEKEKNSVGMLRAETELQTTVLQLAATGGGWPTALRDRILTALDGPCSVNCTVWPTTATMSPANALRLEVDEALTTPGAVTSGSWWLRRSLINLGAATGIPMFKRRAEYYRSRPASVLLSDEPIKPRECFAMRGNASVALRIAGASGFAEVRQIVIEQLPHQAGMKLWSLPRRFEIWGEPQNAKDATAGDRFTVPLGSFEYHAAAPAPQAFELQNHVPVRALRIDFSDINSHGPQHFFCVYRVRAFETKPPSCSYATSLSPARLVAPVKV